LAVDRGSGPYRGRVYAGGKLPIRVFGRLASDVGAIAGSADGGMSFGAPRLFMPDPVDEFLHIVSDMIVAPDGALLVALATILLPDSLRQKRPDPQPRTFIAEELEGRYLLLRSTDGGRSFEGPHEVGAWHLFGHGRPEQSVKGLGGGRLAVDASGGPFHGTIYLTWTEAIADRVQIVLASSRDNGRTWRTPQRVNDGGEGSNHSNPALAVNDAGEVAITWNDRREDPDDRCFHFRAAIAVEGGRTIGPSARLSDHPACPIGRWANGGDTQGLVGLPGGDFAAAWIGGPGARTSLRYARFRRSLNAGQAR
jgi:hypothetical protein